MFRFTYAFVCEYFVSNGLFHEACTCNARFVIFGGMGGFAWLGCLDVLHRGRGVRQVPKLMGSSCLVS